MAEESNGSNLRDMADRVEIYSADEDRIKHLGEVFSNNSSRKILSLLTQAEMTSSDIAEGADLSLSLTIHHLEKMQDAGIVKVTKVSRSSKGHDMKYYSAKSTILIFPKDVVEKARMSKSLSLSLKRIIRFAAVGTAGLTSWLVVRSVYMEGNVWKSAVETTDAASYIDPFAPVVVGLSVVVTGLIIERILMALKR